VAGLRPRHNKVGGKTAVSQQNADASHADLTDERGFLIGNWGKTAVLRYPPMYSQMKPTIVNRFASMNALWRGGTLATAAEEDRAGAGETRNLYPLGGN